MSDTLFKQVNYTLGGLAQFIELGQVGLPDIQRPFVWKNAKVRDLFDSMYRGYPVGYLLFWQNGYSGGAKAIGTDAKQKVPDLLIVDGQQRLTSLYAVVKGIPVLRANYTSEHIEIAFNPLQGSFEVADAAIRRDKSYIPNISVLWNSSTGLFKLAGTYLAGLEKTREVNEIERRAVEEAITKLFGLLQFPFTALELSKDIGEEQVAEVFVRINSKGTPLKQADFILTLMSVFWDSGRKELETFCRQARQPSVGGASPFNHYIDPDPDQLLRVGVGIGFRRARLQFVYSILRGKDLETGNFSEQRREEQFEILKAAQSKVLHLQHWHDYFKAIASAGFLGSKMISSNSNLLYTYVFYLLGRTTFKVEEHVLRRVIARWFFMSALTGRYSESPESKMEFDLARFREVKDGGEFVAILDAICEGTLTSDFWKIALPNDLATSSAASPSMYAYYAALVLLDAKTLFSNQPIRSMLDPLVQANKAAVERHHLFPRAHLKSIGLIDLREINQIANYALVEWGDNLAISDRAPLDYLPTMKERVGPVEWERMTYWHALPDGWEQLNYRAFLAARRDLMATVIQDGYAKLGGAKSANALPAVALEALVGGGENTTTEFKATLRTNLHTQKVDSRMEHGCLKSIAGFLNANGGTLVVGVTDDGSPVGLSADGFEDEDKMGLHLVNLVSDRMGGHFMMYVHPRFEDLDGQRTMAVQCWSAKSPVFVKDAGAEKFFVRAGPSTIELQGAKMQEYITMRFGN